MNILNELHLKIKKEKRVIYFGIPDAEKELKEMFNLRYNVYNSLGYLNFENSLNLYEKDEYDIMGKCHYFIAKIDDKIIGTVRLIIDNYLPTEKECFKFEEPTGIKKIPRNQRGEISRLIIIPYKENVFLPRNIVLLFLMKSLIDFSTVKEIAGGYSFITNKLCKKLKKLRIPFHTIKNYAQIYSKKGILYPYFHQKDNSIIPVFYLRNELENYFVKIFYGNIIFRKINDKIFELRSNLYNKFLSLLKII